MAEFFAPSALLPTGWQRDVVFVAGDDGRIVRVEQQVDVGDLSPSAETLSGAVVPGFPNVHSHSFQRGMAGLAEWRASESDSFWSWRETMYQFVLALEPEDLQAIAKFLYAELLKHGYTSVAEFHYVHRDRDGRSYADPAELSLAILAAADAVSMPVTMLPTLYTYGGFGQQSLGEAQRRFRSSTDDIYDLCQRLRNETAATVHQVGVAAHSLRAIDPSEFRRLLEQMKRDFAGGPIHIHIAEQRREVDQSLNWCQQTPVRWAVDNLPIDERWSLIHATHIMGSEIEAIVNSGATVGMCPTTEANLGDGVFPATRFVEKNGQLAIGSDSHVSVSPFEELCELEYLQRLVYQGRNMLASNEQSTGRFLCERAWEAGARSIGCRVGRIAEGYRCDFLVLNSDHPRLVCRAKDQLLDTLVFGGAADMLAAVYVGGKRVVEHGRHVSENGLTQAFAETMERVIPRVSG